MIKFIINIVELVIICRVTYKVVKFFVVRRFGKKTSKGKRNNLSILKKISLLISRKLHMKLNEMIKKQKESLVNTQQSSDTNTKIINMKKYKKINTN